MVDFMHDKMMHEKKILAMVGIGAALTAVGIGLYAFSKKKSKC